MAGVVLQEDLDDFDFESMPRHVVFSSKDTKNIDKTILLGPGTDPSELPLRLPGPTGFRIYRKSTSTTSMNKLASLKLKRIRG